MGDDSSRDSAPGAIETGDNASYRKILPANNRNPCSAALKVKSRLKRILAN